MARGGRINVIGLNTRVRDWYDRKAGSHLLGRWVKSLAHHWDYMLTRRTLLDEVRRSLGEGIPDVAYRPVGHALPPADNLLSTVAKH